MGGQGYPVYKREKAHYTMICSLKIKVRERMRDAHSQLGTLHFQFATRDTETLKLSRLGADHRCEQSQSHQAGLGRD